MNQSYKKVNKFLFQVKKNRQNGYQCEENLENGLLQNLWYSIMD